MRDFIIDPISDEFYHKEQEQRISKSYPNINITTWIESPAISECNSQKSDNERFKGD